MHYDYSDTDITLATTDKDRAVNELKRLDDHVLIVWENEKEIITVGYDRDKFVSIYGTMNETEEKDYTEFIESLL